jgi:hypothetical protein
MLDQSQLNRLYELDHLLGALEQLTSGIKPHCPTGITVRLEELGMVDVKGVDPPVLIPRVLDEQQRCPTAPRLDAPGENDGAGLNMRILGGRGSCPVIRRVKIGA